MEELARELLEATATYLAANSSGVAPEAADEAVVKVAAILERIATP